MKYLRLFIAGIALMLTAQAGIAQNAVFSASSFLSLSKQSTPRTLASTSFAATQVLNFKAAEAEQILMKTTAQTIVLRDFPIEKNNYQTIEITRSRPVIDGATRVMRMTKNGMVEIPKPSLLNFRGKIVGDDKSSVTLVYANGEMYANIYRGDGKQSQIVPSLESNAKGTHLMSSISETSGMPFSCFADQTPEYYQGNSPIYQPDDKHGNATQALDSSLKEAVVALQVDRFAYARLGKNENRIISYINAIFATVSNKYEDEVNITIRIGDVLINTDADPDPYTENAKGDIGALLSEVRTFWVQSLGSIPRDFVHVLTAPGKTQVGGIAFREQLCSKSMGYGVSGIQGGASLPMMTYVWDSFVVTHEIGHTFSARHTHDCWWNPAIDSCVTQTDIDDVCYSNPRKKSDNSSIMSYCHVYYGQSRYTFTPKVAKVIREYVHASPCLSAPAGGAVRIIFPLGGIDQNFRTDTTLTVRWTSSQVNTVNVEYSLDSGKTWNSIAEGASALPGNTKWRLPDGQNSKKCLVRIYDNTKPTVGDTSYAVFSMTTASINLLTPVGGERLPRRSTERLEWKTVNVSRCHVEFSSTGGEPWERLLNNTSQQSYNWTVPDIETSTARIRVVDATNGALIAQSGSFAIGTPTLKLTYPLGGEELCVSTLYRIKWEADFVKTVRVDLSTDGGATYPITQRLTNSADGVGGEHPWVPHWTRVGDKVRIRVVNNADGQMIAESPAAFTIKLCATSDVGDANTLEGFAITSLTPNPASQNFSVRVSNNSGGERELECLLVAADGRSTELGNRMIAAGDNTVAFSLNGDIAQGQYLFVLRSKGQQLTFPLVVVR